MSDPNNIVCIPDQLRQAGIRKSAVTDALLAARAPGYGTAPVSRKRVEEWLAAVRSAGVRTILCLLDEDDLPAYDFLHPGGLIGVYRQAGFRVIHRPMPAHGHASLSREAMALLAGDFRGSSKPLLVHCGAGVVRTGRVLAYLELIARDNPIKECSTADREPAAGH